MKALLICPDERAGLAALAESAPLPNLPILGKLLVGYWLEHLRALGAQEVVVLVVDRPEHVRAEIGNGARWGLRATVCAEKRELTPEEARVKHRASGAVAWLPAPHDVVLMDHLPGLPQAPLTRSYADWFAAIQALMLHAMTPDRIGVRELRPGVWVGLHAQVASTAKLLAPCWIGEHAWIAPGATIGPNALLEREVFVARGATVTHSVIGPKTFVGEFTEVRNSIAWGSTLINWERDSCLKVTDEFLLCSLDPPRANPAPAKRPVIAGLRKFDLPLPTAVVGEFGPP